jgi:hypothetical protein
MGKVALAGASLERRAIPPKGGIAGVEGVYLFWAPARDE